METLDRAKLAVEQAEADEIPELYDKRPNWPQAEPGHSHMTRQSPESILHSQCCKWVIVILYSTPSVPSLGCRDWVVSTFCGLAETIMSNQSWEENHTFAARLEQATSLSHSSSVCSSIQFNFCLIRFHPAYCYLILHFF